MRKSNLIFLNQDHTDLIKLYTIKKGNSTTIGDSCVNEIND